MTMIRRVCEIRHDGYCNRREAETSGAPLPCGNDTSEGLKEGFCLTILIYIENLKKLKGDKKLVVVGGDQIEVRSTGYSSAEIYKNGDLVKKIESGKVS